MSPKPPVKKKQAPPTVAQSVDRISDNAEEWAVRGFAPARGPSAVTESLKLDSAFAALVQTRPFSHQLGRLDVATAGDLRDLMNRLSSHVESGTPDHPLDRLLKPDEQRALLDQLVQRLG